MTISEIPTFEMKANMVFGTAKFIVVSSLILIKGVLCYTSRHDCSDSFIGIWTAKFRVYCVILIHSHVQCHVHSNDLVVGN